MASAAAVVITHHLIVYSNVIDTNVTDRYLFSRNIFVSKIIK